MKAKTYIRILLIVLIVSISCIVVVFTRQRNIVNSGNPDCSSGKCDDQQKTQTEFIFWESLSRNILSAGR